MIYLIAVLLTLILAVMLSILRVMKKNQELLTTVGAIQLEAGKLVKLIHEDVSETTRANRIYQ